jgi:hypothetical protein
MSAVVAMVVEPGINFYSYDFQKYISDGSWTMRGLSRLCFGRRGAGFYFTKRRRQCLGGGSHKS